MKEIHFVHCKTAL